MDLALVGPFRPLALCCDQQSTVLDTRVDRLVCESRHLEVEMVRVLLPNHIDRWHHVPVRSIELSEQPLHARVEKPAPAGPSVFKPEFFFRPTPEYFFCCVAALPHSSRASRERLFSLFFKHKHDL